MATSLAQTTNYQIKEPKGLSDRIMWLRNYYFEGCKRNWNNEYTAWSTGTPSELLYHEMTQSLVQEVYMLLDAL